MEGHQESREITPDLLRTHRFDIDIKNYEKWNPGGDKHRRWIKLDVNFFKDEKMHGLTSAEQTFYLSLLLARASLGRRITSATLSWCHGNLSVHVGQASRYLLKLSKLHIIDLTNLQPLHARIEKRREEKNRGEEIDAAPPDPSPRASKFPDLKNLWNENCGTLTPVVNMNPQRIKQWALLWKEKPALGFWREVIKRLSGSPFASGKNDRGWKANVDFFLRPNTHLKIAEGQYDQNASARRKTNAELNSSANKELWDKLEAEEAALETQ